jgi:hypothetical protein
MGRRFWHIAHPTWEESAPLRCRDSLVESGADIPWLWDEAPDGTDTGVVCVFPDDERGREEAGWLLDDRPGYKIVRVDIPEDHDLELVRAEWEDYPAIRHEIPAQYLTKVEAIGE